MWRLKTIKSDRLMTEMITIRTLCFAVLRLESQKQFQLMGQILLLSNGTTRCEFHPERRFKSCSCFESQKPNNANETNWFSFCLECLERTRTKWTKKLWYAIFLAATEATSRRLHTSTYYLGHL